jgi:hypothetical protein
MLPRSRFQFTLATLMLLMALAGFAAQWYSLHRKVVAAQLECDQTHSVYRDGTEVETVGRRIDAWYCHASRELCEAQCAPQPSHCCRALVRAPRELGLDRRIGRSPAQVLQDFLLAPLEL